MVATVKTKAVRSLKKGEKAVLLPGATEAEPWELWVLGGDGEAECVQVCDSPLASRLRKNTTLALPVSQVFCLPLWLNETDQKQFAGIIPLQLELRGLQPRGQDAAVFDWSVIAQEESRTLVTVGVLPATLAEGISAEAFATFDLSVRYLSLPEDSLILWQEQGNLAVAMTRGSHLVYFQTLADSHLTPRVLQDLHCTRAALTMQGVLSDLQKVVLWMEATPGEIAGLQTVLPLKIEPGQRPSPRLPKAAWKLTPALVTEARRTREKLRWRHRCVWLLLTLYLVLVAVMVGRFFITSLKVNDLKKWQTEHAAELDALHQTQAVWKDLRPVVDIDSSPVELLLHVQEALPSDQLHLTDFETTEGHLMIKGEAKNFGAASQFEESLKRDSHFSDYTWDMGQPRLLPNDLAQLQIEGTRAN